MSINHEVDVWTCDECGRREEVNANYLSPRELTRWIKAQRANTRTPKPVRTFCDITCLAKFAERFNDWPDAA